MPCLAHIATVCCKSMLHCVYCWNIHQAKRKQQLNTSTATHVVVFLGVQCGHVSLVLICNELYIMVLLYLVVWSASFVARLVMLVCDRCYVFVVWCVVVLLLSHLRLSPTYSFCVGGEGGSSNELWDCTLCLSGMHELRSDAVLGTYRDRVL